MKTVEREEGRSDFAAGLVWRIFAEHGDNMQGKVDKSCSPGICFGFSNPF
jgi:hypothetical protein